MLENCELQLWNDWCNIVAYAGINLVQNEYGASNWDSLIIEGSKLCVFLQARYWYSSVCINVLSYFVFSLSLVWRLSEFWLFHRYLEISRNWKAIHLLISSGMFLMSMYMTSWITRKNGMGLKFKLSLKGTGQLIA